MWDLRIANPFGRLSIRNMLAFVAAVVAASLAFILLTAPTTHAADITWDGDTLKYGGNQYQKAPESVKGLPKGDVYVYIEPKDDSAGANAPAQKAHVISFSGSAKDAESAKYAVYDFVPPNTFKNPSGQKTVSSEKKGDDKKSSCVVDGIGWIVCPVTTFLANSVDWLYSNVLTKFLEVRPAESNQNNPLFTAWAIMRNFANVAFVIAFLVIIYSQVTSVGLSNYGIKRLLPRLVVAAVLVNISYWICAIAIDASNILGYSLNDLMMGVTESIRNSGSNTSISWGDATATILSGTALGAVGLLTVGSVSGAIAMLLPLLVGVLVAAIVAVIIMAARQAIIVILVIISPLAFVAYLLPNTEKYFDKWKDLLMTMLLLFPIFSVIFGGSQLAGTAIIQNADSMVMLLLGMAVQVVPLVIVPFLMKFSGSLLGRIGGMTNDRTKGMVDRTRGFANSIAESKKKKNLARPNTTWRRNALSRSMQALDNGRRKREGLDKANDALADARWEGSKAAHKVHDATARSTMIKEAAESRSERHVEIMKRTNDSMQALELQARAAKLDVEDAKKKVEANWTEFEAGRTDSLVRPNDLALQSLARHVHQTSLESAATDLRQEAAKRQHTTDVSNALISNDMQVDNKKILTYAGGIQEAIGEEAALSKAVTSHRKQLFEGIENNLQLMNHFNVSMSDKVKIALGKPVEATDSKGNKFEFRDVIHAREAAIDEVMKKGSYGDIDKLIIESGPGGATHDYADTIGRLIKPAGVDSKALYWGSKMISDIEQGKINGVEGRNRAIVHHLENGKITADKLAGMDATALQYVFNIAQQVDQYEHLGSKPAALRENAQHLRDTVQHILDVQLLKSKSTEKGQQNMRRFLNGEIIPEDQK